MSLLTDKSAPTTAPTTPPPTDAAPDQVTPSAAPAPVVAEAPAQGESGVPASQPEAKPSDSNGSEKTSESAPEKYELKLPENSKLDPKVVEDIAAYARENGLTQKQAEGLLNRENAAVESFATRQAEAVKAQVDNWINEVHADKEMGGDNLKEYAENARRVLDRFDPEGKLKAKFEETGLGNYPEFVRIFGRIGKAMREDKLVTASQSTGQLSLADRVYGKGNAR